AEVLLEEAAGRAEAPAETKPPDPRPPDPAGKEPTAEEKAQAAVDAARATQEAARHKLKLVQVRKELLDRVSASLDAGQSASIAFPTALDDLNPNTIEIGLRVKDGSLAADQVPAELSPDALEKKRKDLAADQVRRKQKAAEAPKAQAAVVRQLEEANKAVLAAEAEVTQAGKALAQEQKRREMENAFARKSPDEMLTELARLVEEGDGLKGTYELA